MTVKKKEKSTTSSTKQTFTIEELLLCFPATVRSECVRFQQSFPSRTRCKERLHAYLEWRELHGLDNKNDKDEDETNMKGDAVIHSDAEHWENASRRAMEHHQSRRSSNGRFDTNSMEEQEANNSKVTCTCSITSSRSTTSTATSSNSSAGGLYREEDRIPQILFCHSSSTPPSSVLKKKSSCNSSSGRDDEDEEVDHTPSVCPCLRDRNGHRILHHLPALIDYHSYARHEDAVDTYTTALALYLDATLDRCSYEQVTLAIDVRPGRGWPNPPAVQMISFIRQVAQSLHELYPARLHRCVIYPVPIAAVCIWKILRNLMDRTLTERIILIAGGADLDSSPPNDKLLQYIDPEGLQLLEEARLAAFSAPVETTLTATTKATIANAS